jgi:fatty acid desaturase
MNWRKELRREDERLGRLCARLAAIGFPILLASMAWYYIHWSAAAILVVVAITFFTILRLGRAAQSRQDQ